MLDFGCKGKKLFPIFGAYINIRCKKCCVFKEKPYICIINQNISAMKYDTNPVHLLYDNEEMRERILMVMDGRDKTTGITFVSLCYQIIQLGFQENKVKIPADTIITSEELAPEEQVRVSRILWELIWDRKIFLLFGRSDLLGLSNGEDRFVKY